MDIAVLFHSRREELIIESHVKGFPECRSSFISPPSHVLINKPVDWFRS